MLGAVDAAHADHYSSASASHVRVSVKDGTLGVGASRGQADTEKTGLGSFQDLLGRLNGKTEAQVVREEKARKELGCRSYVAQRFGSANFVKAGYLVGDRMEKVEPESPDRCPAASQAQPSPVLDAPTTRLSETFAWAEPPPSPEKQKRRKVRIHDSDAHDDDHTLGTAITNDTYAVESSSTDKERRNDSPVCTETTAIAEHQKRYKEQRKNRKAEKKRRREERQARHEVKVNHTSSIPSHCQPSSNIITANAIFSPISKTSTTFRLRGARQRNIQHKRMAMDPRALQGSLP